MAKGIPAAHSPRAPELRRVGVTVPRSAALAALLHGAGGKFEKQLSTLAITAHPDHHAQRTVYFAAGEAGHVAGVLAALLARARAAGDPAAGALADVAAQLGVREQSAPAAEPAPAPRPAPRPAPAPAP